MSPRRFAKIYKSLPSIHVLHLPKMIQNIKCHLVSEALAAKKIEKQKKSNGVGAPLQSLISLYNFVSNLPRATNKNLFISSTHLFFTSAIVVPGPHEHLSQPVKIVYVCFSLFVIFSASVDADHPQTMLYL